jgi:hypothetical protein
MQCSVAWLIVMERVLWFGVACSVLWCSEMMLFSVNNCFVSTDKMTIYIHTHIYNTQHSTYSLTHTHTHTHTHNTHTHIHIYSRVRANTPLPRAPAQYRGCSHRLQPDNGEAGAYARTGEGGGLDWTTLHYTALHCTTLHYIVLHYGHCTALHCNGPRALVRRLFLHYTNP